MGRPHAIPITDLRRRYWAPNLKSNANRPSSLSKIVVFFLSFLSLSLSPSSYFCFFFKIFATIRNLSLVQHRITKTLQRPRQWIVLIELRILKILFRVERIPARSFLEEGEKMVENEIRKWDKSKDLDGSLNMKRISSAASATSLTSAPKLQYQIDLVWLVINNVGKKLTCQIFALLHYHWNSHRE